MRTFKILWNLILDVGVCRNSADIDEDHTRMYIVVIPYYDFQTLLVVPHKSFGLTRPDKKALD